MCCASGTAPRTRAVCSLSDGGDYQKQHLPSGVDRAHVWGAQAPRLTARRPTRSIAGVFGMFRKWRRERLEKLAFPAERLGILQKRVPYYRLLSRDEQTQLQKLVRVFILEKEFEGCGAWR